MADSTARIAEWVAEAADAVAAMGDAEIDAIGRIAAIVIDALAGGGKVLLVGNGGSAADAQHIAGELAGRFRRERPALACAALTTDTSVITAVGNDYDFASVFSRQVDALGRPGDVLWALSTSGDSPNVIAAAEAARTRGMSVVAMTGSTGGALAPMADACLRAPAERNYLIQLLHQVAYHTVCELAEAHFAPDTEGAHGHG